MHVTAKLLLKYDGSQILFMTTSEKSNIRRREEASPLVPMRRHMDDIFEDFRREMESMFHPWPYSMTGWRFPVLADIDREIRLPLCDMVDKGDKYELQLEILGIDKDKIDVKATKNSVEISGEQSEKTEDKKKDYVYNERSYRSFHRKSPHDFPKVKIRNPESICSNCSTETSQICEWCGTCYKYHKGLEIEKEY